MKKIRVLVTGAGSGVGQGIIKSLNASELPLTLIGADIGPLNSGLYRTDEAVLIPRVEQEGALAEIINLLGEHNIDIVMIGSEYDLAFFAKNKRELEEKSGALIVVSPLKTIEIADDKYLTAKFLRDNNLPYANFWLPRDRQEAIEVLQMQGTPIVLKTRRGTSNRHVHVIQSEQELEMLYDTVPNPMLQELIAMPKTQLEREYTCSVFRCSDSSILGPFTARRTLRNGNSWIVEVDQFQECFPLLIRLGNLLPTMGSLNVQLMLTDDGPVPFEFNSRFSGTTAIRTHFGFNEPDMAIRNYYLKDALQSPHIRKGVAFRYLEEVFIDNLLSDQLGKEFPRGEVRSWF